MWGQSGPRRPSQGSGGGRVQEGAARDAREVDCGTPYPRSPLLTPNAAARTRRRTERPPLRRQRGGNGGGGVTRCGRVAAACRSDGEVRRRGAAAPRGRGGSAAGAAGRGNDHIDKKRQHGQKNTGPVPFSPFLSLAPSGHPLPLLPSHTASHTAYTGVAHNQTTTKTICEAFHPFPSPTPPFPGDAHAHGRYARPPPANACQGNVRDRACTAPDAHVMRTNAPPPSVGTVGAARDGCGCTPPQKWISEGRWPLVGHPLPRSPRCPSCCPPCRPLPHPFRPWPAGRRAAA